MGGKATGFRTKEQRIARLKRYLMIRSLAFRCDGKDAWWPALLSRPYTAHKSNRDAPCAHPQRLQIERAHQRRQRTAQGDPLFDRRKRYKEPLMYRRTVTPDVAILAADPHPDHTTPPAPTRPPPDRSQAGSRPHRAHQAGTASPREVRCTPRP